MWLAWHLIASSSHTSKFLPFVCSTTYLVKDVLGKVSRREEGEEKTIFWCIGHSRKSTTQPQKLVICMNNSVFLWSELWGWTQLSHDSHQAAISSGTYLSVSWPRSLWGHNIARLQIELFGGFKACGSDYLMKNCPGQRDYKEQHGAAYPRWAVNNRARRRDRGWKKKGVQSFHRKAL